MKKMISVFFFIIFPIMSIEEPKYQVLIKDNEFELRSYSAMLVAEVYVEGSFEDASNKGFREVADFIFGNNVDPKTKESKNIAMTAPVTIDKSISQTTLNRKLFFIMPSQFNIDTLPKPKNKNIIIRQLDVQDVAVMTFSGFLGDKKVENNILQLKKWVEKNNLIPEGGVQISRYNPPWTLPFLRRNEIWLKITSKK